MTSNEIFAAKNSSRCTQRTRNTAQINLMQTMICQCVCAYLCVFSSCMRLSVCVCVLVLAMAKENLLYAAFSVIYADFVATMMLTPHFLHYMQQIAATS